MTKAARRAPAELRVRLPVTVLRRTLQLGQPAAKLAKEKRPEEPLSRT
jgi:hypothetical protein